MFMDSEGFIVNSIPLTTFLKLFPSFFKPSADWSTFPPALASRASEPTNRLTLEETSLISFKLSMLLMISPIFEVSKLLISAAASLLKELITFVIFESLKFIPLRAFMVLAIFSTPVIAGCIFAASIS